MNLEQPPIYAGAKKKEDGTIDKTSAAIMPDPEGKIAKKFEEQTNKQERELKEGFDWEKQLVARRDELQNKNSRQGLSEHGQIELNRLIKAIEALHLNDSKKVQQSLEYLPELLPRRKRELIDAKNALKEIVENIPHDKLKTMSDGLMSDFIEGSDGDVNRYAKEMLQSESIGNDPDVAAFHVAEKLNQIKEVLLLKTK